MLWLGLVSLDGMRHGKEGLGFCIHTCVSRGVCLSTQTCTRTNLGLDGLQALVPEEAGPLDPGQQRGAQWPGGHQLRSVVEWR